MARGDLKWVNSALFALGNKEMDLDADTLKAAIIDNTTTITPSLATPAWGAGGTTNLSANQCATGTSYTGPITLTKGWGGDDGLTPVIGIDIVEVDQDAVSGFTDGYYAVIYNDTHPSKLVLGYVDLGGPIDLTAGPLRIRFNSDASLGYALRLNQA
jgi:hypothetical protein